MTYTHKYIHMHIYNYVCNIIMCECKIPGSSRQIYLQVKPLYTRQDTISLGPEYKNVLEQKRLEYENILRDTKTTLEPEVMGMYLVVQALVIILIQCRH